MTATTNAISDVVVNFVGTGIGSMSRDLLTWEVG